MSERQSWKPGKAMLSSGTSLTYWNFLNGYSTWRFSFAWIVHGKILACFIYFFNDWPSNACCKCWQRLIREGQKIQQMQQTRTTGLSTFKEPIKWIQRSVSKYILRYLRERRGTPLGRYSVSLVFQRLSSESDMRGALWFTSEVLWHSFHVQDSKLAMPTFVI